MGLTFKQTETVTIEAEIEGLDSAISGVIITIDGEDGAPILPETAMTQLANQQFQYFWETLDFDPATWVASTAYTVDIEVQPPVPNGQRYVCIEAGDSYLAEPTDWLPGSEPGTLFYDSPPLWESGKVYALDDEVIPSDDDFCHGVKYVCTSAGTAGASEPGFDSDIGDTTIDGTVVWTATAWNYAKWKIWSLSIEPEIYDVVLKATDSNGHIGIERFTIRIVE